MKKFILLFITLMLSSFSAYASEIVDSVSLSDYLASSVTIKFDIFENRVNKYSEVYFDHEIDGEVYTKPFIIKREDRTAEITFEVPPFVVGKEMTLTPVSGIDQLRYYDDYIKVGESVKLSTYISNTEDGPTHNTTFHMTIYPLYYKDVEVFINNEHQAFSEHTYLAEDEYAFVPIIELSKALGIENAAYNNVENAVEIAYNGKYIKYYLDTKAIDLNGKAITGDCDADFVYTTVFAPVRPFAELFGSNITFTDEGTHYRINFDTPKDVIQVHGKAHVMNERGISSDTDYLVWVSKSEFLVRVYIGSKDNWEFVKSFPCAIGAPNTPTCEGQYRYYQYQDRWSYGSYYCGPIMRFNGGYAIHSTLIRYNGVPYDNRVGQKISHGCVRVRPEGIQWLVDYVPLYSRIYVTA